MSRIEQIVAQLGGTKFLRRVAVLLVMLSLLVFLRKLIPVVLAFLLCVHALGWLGRQIARVLRAQHHHHAIRIALVVMLFIIAGGGFWGYKTVARSLREKPFAQRVTEVKQLARSAYDEIPKSITESTYFQEIKEEVTEKFLGSSKLEKVETYIRITLYTLLGIIMAVVYLLDRKKVDGLLANPSEEHFGALLYRYFLFWGEAVLITIKLQVIVALVNTVLTLPVLLFLKLPHVAALSFFIFFCSLIPILGNFISGAVLIILSYQQAQMLGAIFFLITTAVLHKLEAYYLNPRLTSKHVQLPTVILVFSLIVFESVFGLVGVFLSFPTLYVGMRILQDFKSVRPIDNSADLMPQKLTTEVAV